jgi:hypothetical protein
MKRSQSENKYLKNNATRVGHDGNVSTQSHEARGPLKSLKSARRALVAHACNPSYSEDRNLEDRGSKSDPGNSLPDLI